MKNKKESINKLIQDKFGKLYKQRNWNGLESDEKFSKKSYSQWIENNFNNNGEITKSIEDNPDILNEAQGLWFRKEATEEQKELIRKLLEKLTKRQRQIVELLGYEGKSLDHAALILKIKKQTIKNTIQQIRKKFHGTFSSF